MYKVVQWYNDGVPGSALLDIFDVMPGSPITAMEISKKVRDSTIVHKYTYKRNDVTRSRFGGLRID